MENLTPTAHTILGYVASHPRSGYEIRQAASRNPFWGISDGQLYPQLRLLAGAGLIESDGMDGPRGKTIWRITPSGRQALRDWLGEETPPVVIRDENLVKLLFAAPLDRGLARALVEERRAQFASFRDLIAAVAPGASWTDAERSAAATVPALVRDYGLEFADDAVAWCDRVLDALDGDA
ncbi:PadR family transcriptional regulator [Microbacterium azadirachtae]|uniref:PadR family transcriptional regulator n=1 Tax=Microbacterium azadirachtae TaxID=582680 RepID=UPI00088A7FF1|nr:PadR family transcriptional regulator [Microbacterium azadirachtae]SDL89358.1 DNA-binding transcriptional regulator, PadR family [Microbacterium azadirachtae]SEG18121.1 DNA-binding transcriptional regulator, PadR family [Microbacterium azadirachtae]SEG20516.1 DNA-binding transcriptional regulator, PadR family [Microbacterium azadirachtae]